MTEVSFPDAQPYGAAVYEAQIPREVREASVNRPRWNHSSYDLFDKYSYPGKFIIFNHSEFDAYLGLKKRSGTDKDADRVEKTLKNLGFVAALERQNNLTYDDIMEKLQTVLDQDFNDYGSIVVVILTHGEERQLYAHDEAYDIDKIKQKFIQDEVAKKLAKKPKMFLIQACQGQEADSGVLTEAEDGAVGSGGGEIPYYEDITIPIMADFLLAFGSPIGYASFRADTGSWFIQALCDAIDELNKTTDFESILTMVKYDIAYNKTSNSEFERYHKKKQIPEVTSTFTKKLYLAREAQLEASIPAPGGKRPLLQTAEGVRQDSVPKMKTQQKTPTVDSARNSPPPTLQPINPCLGENYKNLILWILICIISTFIGTWYLFTESQPEYHFHCHSAQENSTSNNVHIHPL